MKNNKVRFIIGMALLELFSIETWANENNTVHTHQVAIYNSAFGIVRDTPETIKIINDETLKANKGDTSAQLHLGDLFSNGIFATPDRKQAIAWYTKASEQGLATASERLGDMYNGSLNEARDYQQAAFWYTKAAEQGSVSARLILGRGYYLGENGLTQNYKLAVFWLTKAAEQRDADAQYWLGEIYFLLGDIYRYGRGVPQDYKQAFAWYTKSAEQKNTKAQVQLDYKSADGKTITKDNQQAWPASTFAQASALATRKIKFYDAVAKAQSGDAEAQYNLAELYSSELNNDENNNQNALDDSSQILMWRTLAAKQGYAKAQFKMGMYYYNADDKQAFYWFSKAADQGNAEAEVYLGHAYSSGHGVTKDYKQAMAWYTKAADQNFADAQYYLGWEYYRGERVTQDYKQAFDWFSKAAEQGHADAQVELGKMYANGEGVTQNYKQAYIWSVVGETNNYGNPTEVIGTAAAKLTPTELEEAKRAADELTKTIEQRTGKKRVLEVGC